LELTVSNGILSGVRTVEKEGGKFLQVTAPISHGSSGGPLFNMAGEVVGITSMYFEGGENLNFAIPVNDAKGLMRNQSAKLQNLPNEIPAPSDVAATNVRAGTLAEQKACREEVEKAFIQTPAFPTTYSSHFDPTSGVCYMDRERRRLPPSGSQDWLYVHSIENAYEDQQVGVLVLLYVRSNSETGYTLYSAPQLCYIHPPGEPEITCTSEKEFDSLALNHFGITPR
jgi:hypothetical protein